MKNEKSINTWKLNNNTATKKKKKKVNEEIMKYYKPENGNTNLQNLCHTAEAKTGKFIARQSFLKKQENNKSQTT